MSAAGALAALLLAVPAAGAPARPAGSLAQDVAASAAPLVWDDLPPWPGGIGVGGPLAGVDGGALIVAGGANFPDAPPWEGGAKVWYDGVFVLEAGDAQWRAAGRLPHPLAYGASVETPEGLALIGGSDAEHVYSEVLLLRLVDGALSQARLPDLPTPMAFGAAQLIGERIYVLPGKRSKAAEDLRPGFWCLDLAAPADERAWLELPPPPCAPRAKAVAVVQADGFETEALYLFSGEVTTVGAAGEPTYTYLADGWRFEPAPRAADGGTWRPTAPPPHPVAAGSALPFGQSHVLVFSGVRGVDPDVPLAEREEFPAALLAYHTITDTWVAAGALPEGVVTSAAVAWRGDLVLVSGEVRPGVRTPRVQRARSVPADVRFGALNWTVLGLYLASLVVLGWWFSRRERGTDDYFLAGRRIPWWAAGLSIFGTMLSAITFLSVPAVGFATDCVVAPSWLTIPLLAPIVVAWYLPRFRRLDLTTAYEYLERRFGLGARLFGSLAFMLFQLGRMAVVVYLPALALSTFTGLEVHACILTIGLLSTLYTVLGGIEAVVWTDVLQVLVLLGGLTVALLVAVSDVGGPGAVLEAARAADKLTVWRWGGVTEMTTWGIVIGSFFLNFGPYTTDQATVQRYLTTPDERGAARGIWLNGLLSVPAGLLFFGLGLALFAWFQAHPGMLAVGMKTDEVLPLFVARRLPQGVSGLVIAGVFAASMSSLDSSMHGIATAFTTDVYRRFRRGLSDAHCLRVARAVTVSMGAAGTLAALWLARTDVTSLFFFFQKLLGLVSSGVAGVFFLGVFTRRTNQAGALVGAAASTAVVAWLTFATDVNFYLYGAAGMLTCVVTGWLASPAPRTPATPRAASAAGGTGPSTGSP